MSGVEPKNDNDPYTGTEYQHDFGPKHGLPFGVKVIKDDKSKGYRDYVDKYHLWNSTTNGRNVDEWAYTDESLVAAKIFKVSDNSSVDKKTLKQLSQGEVIKVITNTYKVYNAPGGKRSPLKGAELANKLQIPNNSVAIIDTDGMIGRSMKVNTKRKNARSVDDQNFTLYIYTNCVISADSAGKVNIENESFFSGISGINCVALINRQDIIIPSNNNQMKMNYWVENTWMDVGKTKQKWTARDIAGDDDDVREFTKVEFTDAHHENNRSAVFKAAQKIIKKTGGIEHLKDPTANRQHDHRITQPLNKIDDGILALMRKRSGDLFQGWMAKHLINHGGTVRERFYTKNGFRWVMNETEPKEFITWKNEKDAEALIDIFATTIDYPFLVWCLENGVNVLFRVGGRIMYFKKQ